jgi:hypothetical protein
MEEEEFQRNRFNFLITEAHTGLTFADIALTVPIDNEKRSRNTINARLAYDTVGRFRCDLILSESQEAELNGLLNKHRANLVQLGEKF